MTMENYFSVGWETHVEITRIPSIISEHLYGNPTNGTGVTHLGIHRQFQCTWMDAKAYFDPLNSKSHDSVACWLGWTLVSNYTCL